MAFKLNGNPLAVDVPFSVGNVNYPANWLRLSTAEEKTALGITEVADGSYKKGDLMKDENANQIVNLGVKSVLKALEKNTAGSLLARYDWYVVRKAEKDIAIPTAITTYRDAVRTACNTRETEIDACADTAALVTLYGASYDENGDFEKMNMTQYPVDPQI